MHTEEAIFKGKFAALMERNESVDVFNLTRGQPDFSMFRMILEYYHQVKFLERAIGFHFPGPGASSASVAWLVAAKTI